MSDIPTVPFLPLTNVTFLKPSYNMSFHNGTEVVGRFDFNGPKMTFEGNADESVDLFVKALSHWFEGRLKQEREAEREACASFIENWKYAKECAAFDQPTQGQYAAAIRARGET